MFWNTYKKCLLGIPKELLTSGREVEGKVDGRLKRAIGCMGIKSSDDTFGPEGLVRAGAGVAAIGTDVGVVAAGVGSVALAASVGMGFKVGKLVGRIKRK